MDFLKDIFIDKLGLEMHHLEKFISLSRAKSLKKKEHLIQEGAVCEFVGFVISGKLRSYVQNDNQEFNNDFYLQNSLVTAYTSYLTQSQTNCNIEALSDTQIVYITHKQFNTLIEEDVHFLKLAKYISDVFFIKKCKRETSFLKNSATERYELLCKTYPGIEQEISQYHIASYLGIKPESLSRIKLLTYINK
ncbi:Crp/Fnr family transcriptional regulator [Flavobacterium hydrophilum]|uniref:Crp/Fnr family transcriptional regulator n=1 Tax=Flavobacterium hydrophilum TaxID=2211445 RepID=A0A2V4BYX3_9FLAO|nr:Crp/Fnr family transcriptional regulator [Flavobacterium hydrophilum]PXY44228.1 Crp/Fnr family transcriptional regulator [Flavobacterium hydrophilum]